MVNQTESQPATEGEVAAAQQEAMEYFERQRVRAGEKVAEMPLETREGTIKPLQYRISPADVGSWVPVWELKIDADGEVYGEPTRAPRQQLGLWLTKKRGDGGQRFTVDMPNRLLAEATIPCLYNGTPPCSKKFYTRQDMVMHVYGTHPMFSTVNKALLETIMQRIAEDNPRLAEMAEAIANMKERGLVSVPVTPKPRDESIDITAGAPIVSSFGIQPQFEDDGGCGLCEWKPKDDMKQPEKARYMHLLMKHREELE